MPEKIEDKFNALYAPSIIESQKKGESGYLTERDLSAEKKAIGNFGKVYGRLPGQTGVGDNNGAGSSTLDWQLINNALYGQGSAPGSTPQDTLANAVDGGVGSGEVDLNVSDLGTGNKETTDITTTETTAPTQSSTDGFSEFMSSLNIGGIDKIKAPEFTDMKNALGLKAETRINSLSTKYTEDLSDLKTRGTDTTNSLKARLIKLGVSPSDTSYGAALEGQNQRNIKAERSLEREFEDNKARILADSEAQISQLSMKEAEYGYQAQSDNIGNLMQKQNQAIDLWKTFQDNSYQQQLMNLNVLDKVSKVPAGQSIEIGGTTYEGVAEPDSVFSGADFTRIMLETPAGETVNFTDPTSGETYRVMGVAGSDKNLKQFTSLDNQGNFNIISFNPETNEVVGVAEVKDVGKTGNSSTNVTINESKVGERLFVYDKNTGEQIGFQGYNKYTGGTTNFFQDGSPMPELPEGAEIRSANFKKTEGDDDWGVNPSVDFGNGA